MTKKSWYAQTAQNGGLTSWVVQIVCDNLWRHLIYYMLQQLICYA